MKLFIDLTEDERWLDGNIPVKMNERDNLTRANSSLLIGEEVELVLSVRQAITLFDVLDGWLNGGPAKSVGGIERRVNDAITMSITEHPAAVTAMNSRPEELAHVIYENMKFKGVRFRLAGDDPESDSSLVERERQYRERKKQQRGKV